jgi:hypothetical protein
MDARIPTILTKDIKTVSHSMKNDEKFYLLATKEFESGARDEGKWAKLLALSDGDERKAKYSYIRQRAEELIEESQQEAEKAEEANREKEREAWISHVNAISGDNEAAVEALRSFRVHADKNSDGEWIIYKPDGGVWVFRNDSKFHEFTQRFLAEQNNSQADNIDAVTPNERPDSASVPESWISRLVKGDFGLAKTFWLFNVLVRVLVSFSFNVIAETNTLELLLLSMLAYYCYQVPVMVGIWRAANKYAGLQLWAMLARIEVIFQAVGLVGFAILVLSAM